MLLGNVIYAGCQWGMLSALAKLGSPAAVGEYALGLAITAPIFLFASLHFRTVYATDYEGEFSFSEYRRARAIALALALIAVLTVAVLVPGNRAAAAVIVAVAFTKLVEAASDLDYGVFQRSERLMPITRSLILRGLGGVLAVAGGMIVTGSVLWSIVCVATAWLLVFYFVDRPSARRLLREDSRPAPGRSRPNNVRLLVLTTLPLGAAAMLQSLNPNIPRYFVNNLLGTRALGIYAAMAYLTAAGTTVVSAMGAASSARLSRYLAEHRQADFHALLWRMTALAAAVGVAGLVLCIVAGPWLMTVLYTPEYARQSGVLIGVCVTATLLYAAVMLWYGIVALRVHYLQLPLFGLVIPVTCASSWVFIPRYGLVGATFATALSATVQLMGSVAIVIWGSRRSAAASEAELAPVDALAAV